MSEKPVDGFERAVVMVCDDDALRDKISSNAKAIPESHTLGEVGEKLEELYERVLSTAHD